MYIYGVEVVFLAILACKSTLLFYIFNKCTYAYIFLFRYVRQPAYTYTHTNTNTCCSNIYQVVYVSVFNASNNHRYVCIL